VSIGCGGKERWRDQEEQEALDVFKSPRLLDIGVVDEHRCGLEALPRSTNNWVEEIRRLWEQRTTSTLASSKSTVEERG
jgi:hypothetical protein